MAKVIGALIAKYPKIDGMFADLSVPILTSGAFPRAGRDLPLVGGEDANGFGCTWEKLHEKDPKSTFEFTTSSAEQWNIRLAIRVGGRLRRRRQGGPAAGHHRHQRWQARCRRARRQDREELHDGRFA